MSATATPAKPALRGVSHLVAFGVALVAGPWLVVQGATTTARVSAGVYAVGLAALFGCSALFHCGTWSGRRHQRLRLLDRSSIFSFVAGTFTPLSALAFGPGAARVVVIPIWVGAVAGIAITWGWADAPPRAAAAPPIVVGAAALLAMVVAAATLSPGRSALLGGGTVLYALGGVTFARKRPDPVPQIFGYHEVFHALVIVAAICHYVLILELVQRAT